MQWDGHRTYRLPRSPLAKSTRDVGLEGVRAVRAALHQPDELSRRRENRSGRNECVGRPTDSFDEKVGRLLVDGRVAVLERDQAHVLARVEGDTGTYQVAVDERGFVSCTCPCVGPRCTHVAAVRRVTGLQVVA